LSQSLKVGKAEKYPGVNGRLLACPIRRLSRVATEYDETPRQKTPVDL
jgi:hypothetical protein